MGHKWEWWPSVIRQKRGLCLIRTPTDRVSWMPWLWCQNMGWQVSDIVGLSWDNGSLAADRDVHPSPDSICNGNRGWLRVVKWLQSAIICSDFALYEGLLTSIIVCVVCVCAVCVLWIFLQRLCRLWLVNLIQRHSDLGPRLVHRDFN